MLIYEADISHVDLLTFKLASRVCEGERERENELLCSSVSPSKPVGHPQPASLSATAEARTDTSAGDSRQTEQEGFLLRRADGLLPEIREGLP